MLNDTNLKSVTSIMFCFSENSQLPADIWQSSENPDIQWSLMTWSQSHWWSASRRRERLKCSNGRGLQKTWSKCFNSLQYTINNRQRIKTALSQTNKYKTYLKCWSLKIVSIVPKIRGVILRAKWEEEEEKKPVQQQFDMYIL